MHIPRRIVSTFAVTLAILVIGGQSQANLIETFNSENGGIGVLNYTAFTDFSVTVGAVDLIGNGLFDFYPGNGLYVDLNGTTNASGTLESKMSFSPGTYELTFDIGRNPNGVGLTDSVMISLGEFSETFTRTGSVPLETLTRVFTSTTSSASGIFHSSLRQR